MSFSGKNFLVPRDAGCLTDGEIGYDNSSKMEPKCGHQWFTDTTAPELFGHKRQAVEEATTNRPVLGTSRKNVSPLHNTSSLQSVSGQFSDCLFGSDTMRTLNAVDRNIPSIGGGNMNLGRKDFGDPYGSISSMGLTISNEIEDVSRCISFGGIRKVKVNQVRYSSNDFSASMGQSYSRGDDNGVSVESIYDKNDSSCMSLGSTNDNRDNSTVSSGPTFSKEDSNFISMGHTFSKGHGDFVLMGHNYSKGNETILAMGQPFDRRNGNFMTVPSYEKEDGNGISMTSLYGKGHEDFISMGPTFDKANESFISMAPIYSKGDDNTISVGPTFHKMNSNNASMGSVMDKGDSGPLSMGHNYNKGDNITISFGSFLDEPQTDPSGCIINGYDIFTTNQNLAQISEVPSQTDLVPSHADPILNNAPKAHLNTDMAPKNKESKTSNKVSPNNFPSNVKSLLSTGMLDGVPVKYVSWSREKNLKGTIKGTGYLCGCKDCIFSKAISAYEFERHANCKTKHPNNHIYFENGKTIYAVVQELKNTPQEMLFDVIQNVTGSPINQKNFRTWKASYQAASRELQRIYGKDEVVMPC